jgi:hypothetical protein
MECERALGRKQRKFCSDVCSVSFRMTLRPPPDRRALELIC